MRDKRRDELEALVKEVLKKKDRVIPVIGDDCFVGYVEPDGCQRLVPLQQWLAVRMLGNDVSADVIKRIGSEGYRGLDLMHEEYRKLNEDMDFMDFKEAILSAIDEGLEEKSLFLRQDVKDFLQAAQFEVIATTCPYHILEKEIEFGKEKYNVSSFAPISAFSRGGNGVTKSEAALNLPSIYQIFGDCEGEFVCGEEDLLMFLHYLNQTDTEKGYGASELVKYIKDKGQDNKGLGIIMPIGCNNLPNWLFRFLWYPFSQQRIIGKNRNNQGGVWHEYSADKDFYKFLRNFRFKTFSDSTDELKEEGVAGDPVLVRLTNEFKSKVSIVKSYAVDNLKVNWDDSEEWDYFLSYSSDDEEAARKIYDILTEKCDKKVWMDNRGSGRIRPGEEYWTAIQYGIEHSRKFIFLITESYLRKAMDKNHRYETGLVAPTGVYQEIEKIKEWYLIKRRDGQKGYSYPIILEGTKVTYTDYEGVLHEDEELRNGVLENLPRFKEYEMLQTEALFCQIQDCICSMADMENKLIEVFNK